MEQAGGGAARDRTEIRGEVHVIMAGPDGRVKYEETIHNIVTRVGNHYYGDRAAGIAAAPAQVTGMKLGTGDEAPTKTGAGAALETYLTNSHQALEAGFPAGAFNGDARRVSFRAVWAAGKATSASPITEAVLVIDALADATSSAANTIARVLIAAPAKGADDTLTLNWHHDIGG
jgi:hypothetical protein